MGKGDKERATRARRLIARAQEHLASGKAQEARPLLLQAGRLTPLASDDWLAVLDGLVLCGDGAAAQALMQATVPPGVEAADLALRSGRLLMMSGNPHAGLGEFERAAVLRPAHAATLRDLATAAVAVSALPRAVAAFRAVAGLPEATANDTANLARALLETGEAGQALAVAERGVQQAGPAEPYPLVVRALCYLQTGQLAEAAADVDAALACAPEDTVALGLSASVAAQAGRHEEAIELQAGLARRLPQDPLPCANAAAACIERDRWQEARGWFAQAHARGGGVHQALNAQLVLPAIPQSQAEIAGLRAMLAEGLAALAASGQRMPPVQPGLMVMPFYLAYHGQCNRALHEQWSRTSLALAPWLDYTAEACARWRGPREEKIRIGLVSAFFHDHSIGRTTRGFVERLDRRRFHVTTVFLGPRLDDPLARLMGEGADASIEVPLDVLRAREAIAALGLDVLFYQDIGMEPLSRWLAHARLAPVQCYSFGHPDTTGLPTMDWFVSSARFEPVGGEAHYSEKLWCIPEVGTLAWYRQPARVAPLSRSDLGIPENAHFHLCAQALFKLHPGFDALIEGILDVDPQAHVGLVQASRPAFATRLLERLAQRRSLDLTRVHVLPRVSSSDFHRLLAAADVVLDSTHFNGMNTSLEAFAQGRAVITLPGAFQRGRHAAAMYARLGLDDGVALDEADYIRRAVHFGADAEAREDFAQRVSVACPQLFEDDAVIRGFEAFFEHAVQAAL
jgi:protein O-GlcNAc transferase